MATKAKAAKGTKIEIHDGDDPGTFIKIGELKSFSVPGKAVGTIDVTNMDSGEDREFIGDGFADASEVTFECNFVGSDTGQAEVDGALGETRNFKITLADHATTPTTIEFSAIVTKQPDLSGGVGDPLTGSFSVKPTGARTITRAP